MHVSIACSNHVSATSFTPEIILHEAFSGLNIVSTGLTHPINPNTTFEITMTTGSHVVLTLDFSDGSDAVTLSSDVIYSYDVTFTTSHVFVNPEDFTARVTASNDFYSDTTLLRTLNFNEELLFTAADVIFDRDIDEAAVHEWACRQLDNEVGFHVGHDTVYSFPLYLSSIYKNCFVELC